MEDDISTPVGHSKQFNLREAKRLNDTSFDRLWRYYYDVNREVVLTEKEEQIRRRLSNVWDLLTGKILNDKKAVKAHIQWCLDNVIEISERTAYDDLKRAKQLFGDPRVNAPAFEKVRISTILLDLIEVAKDAGDLDNAQKLIRRYNAVNGLEDDIKIHTPRPAITINFNSDEETLKRQADELMKDVTINIDSDE